MKSPDELRRENDALRERISRLSAAILRISATLDVGTVLREVVDSARALTGARYGVIATLGDAGQPREFVSSGLTPEEHQRLTSWSGGTQLFEHLRGLRGTLRLRDLPDRSRVEKVTVPFSRVLDSHARSRSIRSPLTRGAPQRTP